MEEEMREQLAKLILALETLHHQLRRGTASPPVDYGDGTLALSVDNYTVHVRDGVISAVVPARGTFPVQQTHIGFGPHIPKGPIGYEI